MRVYRISNFTQMPCTELTGVPLRAILSWQTPPTGPNFVPVWGNVINTHVQPIIGTQTSVEKIELFRVGGVTVDFIHDSDHLAYQTPMPPATGSLPAGDCAGNQSPFGGDIIVEGEFSVKIDVFDHATGLVLPGAHPLIYQAWVTRTDVASAPFQLTNSFGIALYPPDALFPPVPFPQSVQPAPGPVLGGVAGNSVLPIHGVQANKTNRDGALFDLPAGRTTLKRARRRLGLNDNQDLKDYWNERIPELETLSAREFAARHNLDVGLVFDSRLRVLGKRARELNWWRTPDTLDILRSNITLREVGEKLGIGTTHAKRLRDRAHLAPAA